MAIFGEIEQNIPIPSTAEGREDMFEKARAAANAISLLEKHGLYEKTDPTIDREGMEKAGELAASYAEDPAAASKAFTPKAMSKLPPPALQLTHQILEEFGHSIVHSSVQVRHMVVNKLIQETENPDPRIRVKALELLGKMSDVGLFTERSEVTVTHQTSDELREKLKEKLLRLKDVTPPGDALPAPKAKSTLLDADFLEDDDA